jgi:nucleoside phosphorylase
VLWEGPSLGVSGARAGTILAMDVIVDDPVRRRRLHERTGADAVDMESGALARTGRLAGVLRAVSDTPDRTLGGIAGAVGPGGRTAWGGLVLAFARAPCDFARAAGDARRALRRLEDVAA